ncbi:L-serine ammonia-lyase, iron-sulfur-dependent, subunit alpha [Acetivibrio cellulolyticus]|uniref:L-serine ammonia-lyase, iron-sulfur-dependent, subunit alpha n=1 Tax=Acetivibrio cellulolyticus TaxID=35830 RepID=UPI0001E2E709|nr:L-serine ammonia-lyase, iron-sulfur-dependent, subunit alpha [Acetivibrio cellulolyticus]
MSFNSINEIVRRCDDTSKTFWEVILEDDISERMVTAEESVGKMKSLYMSMKHSDNSYDPDIKSASGLVGNDGNKFSLALEKGILCSGSFIGEVISKALKISESNACMKRIVAAPTAGSCGVIPAILLTYERQNNIDLDKMVESMYVAAGIGEVIAVRAFISGAAGGCQAEIGSASAMAAGALAYLNGGSSECITHAAAMALKNLLGLVCDPVAGLVEVPCVKRNVVGAVNAIACSDMAIAGVRSSIPPDEVIDAMRSVGESISVSLRETGEGGLAATPSAKEYMRKIINCSMKLKSFNN